MTATTSTDSVATILTFFGAMEVGTLGEWTGAIATLAAVILSLVLALTNARKARDESKLAAEDRKEFRQQQVEEAEFRKRRLAGQVTLTSELTHGDWGTFRRYEVHNGGEEPIFNVSIVEHPSDSEGADNSGLPRVAKSWDVIEARGSRPFEGDRSDYHQRSVPGLYTKPWNRFVLFDDGMRSNWARYESGTLRHVLDWPDPDGPNNIGA